MSAALVPPPGAVGTIELADGRRVTYATCGSSAADAHPVLFLHPIQGNRFQSLVLHAPAERLNLRIIAPDRPGVGGSSLLPGRRVADYAADLAELRQLLGIDRFSLMCSSAGTMYALAATLAADLRQHIVGKVTVVAPWVPPSSRQAGGTTWLHTLGCWAPLPLLSACVGLQNSIVHRQAQRSRCVTDLMTRSSPAEVAAFAGDPHYESNNAAYKAMIGEWGRSRAGIVHEMQLCMERAQEQRLHFSYAASVAAPVRVFAGTADSVMPFSAVQDWAQRAQHANVELVAVEGGTHDGLMHTHKAAALEALARDVAAAGAGGT